MATLQLARVYPSALDEQGGQRKEGRTQLSIHTSGGKRGKKIIDSATTFFSSVPFV